MFKKNSCHLDKKHFRLLPIRFEHHVAYICFCSGIHVFSFTYYGIQDFMYFLLDIMESSAPLYFKKKIYIGLVQ